MAATVTISKTIPVDATQNEFIGYGTIAFSGSYPANGDTLDLTPFFPSVPSNGLPLWVEIMEQTAAGQTPTGYLFVYLPGTTVKNGMVAIFSSATNQFTTGAYSTTFANNIIGIKVWFQSFA